MTRAEFPVPRRIPPRTLRHARAHPGRRLALAAIAAIAASGLAGCNAGPSPAEDAPPTLAELRAAREEAAREGMAGENTGSQADTRQVTTVVHRLDLAVDASLTKAWTFPATDTIRESTTVLWQRNGLRIGVLAPAARAAFRETLGPVHGEHRRLVVGTRIPVKLAASTGALAPLTLVLAESDDTAQETTIAGGVVQLLLRVHALDTGQSFVELTPQHHQPRRTYFQDPRERTAAPTTPGHLPLPSDLIGTPFRPLIATVGLGPGEALVVGPILRSGGKTPATPTPEEEATDDDTKIEVQDDATDADEETSDPDHSPRRLGHVLMTGRRMTRAVQSIYLIERPSR